MTLKDTMDYYFAHGTEGREPSGLPDSPCPHQHTMPQAAERCAIKNGNTHIRRVRKGKGVRDTIVKKPRAN